MRLTPVSAFGLMCLLIPQQLVATGDIYVGTDAFGNVFFTDTPPTYIGFDRYLTEASRSGGTVAEFRRNFNAYDGLIQHHAEINKLAPSLVKAVVFAESAFNPSARSKAGAEGLMQLMPHVQVELGVTDSWDPEQSIRGGTQLLGKLMVRYDGDTRLALAAYNAGPGAVDRYGAVPPFAETRAYVDKVQTLDAHFRTRGLTARP